MKDMIKTYARALVSHTLRRRIQVSYKHLCYVGFRYRCPFCNLRTREFLPFGHDLPVLEKLKVVGGGCRQNNVCPVCNSMDRERLLYIYLIHKTDIFSTHIKKVLHVAPEENIKKTLQKCKTLQYITGDIAEKSVMVNMDLTAICFPERSFDVIICNHVFEHILDDRKAMAELFRILKPGGWAILQVPISLVLEETYEDLSIKTPKSREEAFGQADHVRIYAKDYKIRLTQAGFNVNVFKWTVEADTFGGERNVFSLNEEEQIYFARKLCL